MSLSAHDSDDGGKAAGDQAMLPQSIVHNGNVYKSLADHDPQSTTAVQEGGKFYDLNSAWEICSRTPDSMRVCAAYPWAAHALVFADGVALWTALAPTINSSLKAGECASGSENLKQNGNQYGVDARDFRDCVSCGTFSPFSVNPDDFSPGVHHGVLHRVFADDAHFSFFSRGGIQRVFNLHDYSAVDHPCDVLLIRKK